MSQYQLISQPINDIPHNPDLLRRKEGRRDHRVVRTSENEAMLLEIAGSLNSNDLLNQFSRFIVQPCADPFVNRGTNGQGVCNLANLTEQGVGDLFNELRANEQWIEDYRDGVQLWEEYSKLGLDEDIAKWWMTSYLQPDSVTGKITTKVKVDSTLDFNILDCLPSYRAAWSNSDDT